MMSETANNLASVLQRIFMTLPFTASPPGCLTAGAPLIGSICVFAGTVING
jgi:hypothetical protein